MARKKHEFAHIKLRIREDLRRMVEQRAKRNHHSLMNTIRLALEDSFKDEAKSDLWSLKEEMRKHWARYSGHFHFRTLEDDLAEAIEQSSDLKTKILAQQWLKARKEIRRLEEEIRKLEEKTLKEQRQSAPVGESQT
jgi:hypothetical protein